MPSYKCTAKVRIGSGEVLNDEGGNIHNVGDVVSMSAKLGDKYGQYFEKMADKPKNKEQKPEKNK